MASIAAQNNAEKGAIDDGSKTAASAAAAAAAATFEALDEQSQAWVSVSEKVYRALDPEKLLKEVQVIELNKDLVGSRQTS